MVEAGDPIPFFTDNDVADSVGEAILAAGHKLTRLRDVILTDSPDPIVAATAREAGMVLVTHNYRDFRKIVGLTRKEANKVCRIELGCLQPAAAERITAAMGLIEFEWRRRKESGENEPMLVFIGDEHVKVSR